MSTPSENPPGAGKPNGKRKPTDPKQTDLTPKLANEIIALTQGGHPRKRICRALGITELQLANWLQTGKASRGNQHTDSLRAFYSDYEKAAALGEIANEELLKTHAKSNPAAAFKLIQRLEQRAEKEDTDTGEPLENSQWEAFCRAVATGMNGSDAYRSVYGSNSKRVDSSASRLLAIGIVGNRIYQLKKGGERTTHLTVEEKRLIYAQEATDKRNDLRERLLATKLDSELAGHIKEAEKGTVSVTVNVATMSEERRAELMERKRASIQRAKERARALMIQDADAGH